MIKASLIKPNKALPARGAPIYDQIDYFMEEFVNFRDPAGKVLSYPFNNLPEKKELPDYYKTIKNPIDIEKINSKREKFVYKHFDDFIDDIILMLENCCQYNEPNSSLWFDSILLMKFTLDTSRKIMLNCNPEPPIVPKCQTLFLRILEKVMATKCLESERIIINSLRADIQLQNLVIMPGTNCLPPPPKAKNSAKIYNDIAEIENNSGCLKSDVTPYPPNYYVNNANRTLPNGQPEMQRIILRLPGSLDQIHYIIRSFIQQLQAPHYATQKIKLKPKYPRFDVLQAHIFTILRGHRDRCMPGCQLWEDTYRLQEEFIKHRDNEFEGKFSSPGLNYKLADLRKEKEEDCKKVTILSPVLPAIKGIALILSRAQQQSTATNNVQTLNSQWKTKCPNICALVPTTKSNFYLPATFPNELEMAKTDREFITTVGNIPNELVIVGNKLLQVEDFTTTYGECKKATICSSDKFCQETADYPVESLYMDPRSLFYAKFESIDREEPLTARPVDVLMPRMPCLTGDRTPRRLPVPQIADDLHLGCKHDQMQFKRHFPTILCAEKPIQGVGNKEKEVADKYFNQINFSITSGLKIGDVVWLESGKSQVISKIVRLWTRKDAGLLPSGQPNYWGTGTHLMTPPQIDAQEWQSYHHKEVFKVAGNSESNNSNSTETVQVQFSVSGAVKNKAYLLTKEEFETMRPNAPENSVFFCYRKYLGGKNEKGEKEPVEFRAISNKQQQPALEPTDKLVDDEVFYFNSNERYKSYRFPFKKLEQLSADETKKRELEVAPAGSAQATNMQNRSQIATNSNLIARFNGPSMLGPNGPHRFPGMAPRGMVPRQARPLIPGQPGNPSMHDNILQPPGFGAPNQQVALSPSGGSQPPKELDKATTAINPWNPSGPPIRINKKGKRSAPTPYACYRHSTQQSVRQENPAATFGEINKTIAERWKQLTDSDKKEWEEESRHTAKLIKEDDERQAMRHQIDTQPLSPCPNSNQTNSSTPPPPMTPNNFNSNNDSISASGMSNKVFPIMAPGSNLASGAVTPISQGSASQGAHPQMANLTQGHPAVAQGHANVPVTNAHQPGVPNMQNSPHAIPPLPVHNKTAAPTQVATTNASQQGHPTVNAMTSQNNHVQRQKAPMGIRTNPILRDSDYPEKEVYEPPKPIFINPQKSKIKLYHSRIYQNYINRLNQGCRTISDFNSFPIKPETRSDFENLPTRWLDTKKHKQYYEEGILESLDTLRDNMLRSACGMKHALDCHLDEEGDSGFILTSTSKN